MRTKSSEHNVYINLGASNHTLVERSVNDFYATPPLAVRHLLEVEKFNNYIWEPACGMNHITNELRKNDYTVKCSDIVKMVEDNSIRYEEIPVGNDMMFCLNCSKFSKYLAVEEHPVYRYVHPDGRSLTASYRRTEEAQRELFKLFLRAEDLCKTVGYIFRPTPLAVYYKAFFRRDENNKKMWRIFKESMKLNRCSYLKESFFLLVLFIGKLLKVI